VQSVIGSARRLTDGHAAGERAIIGFVHDEVARKFRDMPTGRQLRNDARENFFWRIS
jgi:hypothetical protein